MMTKKTLTQLILRRDLSSFIQKSFHTVNPGKEYLHNWHIDVIADYLLACEAGQKKHLIINMPPRYLKSLSISVAWPAWLLGKDPTKRIIVVSYSQALSIKHSLDTRLIMQSGWYRELFPKTVLTANEKHKFVTDRQGFRLAASVGGTLTGEGGDVIVIDDPHNPADMGSEVRRLATLEWFDQVLASRLDNKRKGMIALVMQRLHEEDLTGYLLNKPRSNWEQLLMPIMANEKIEYMVSGRRYYFHDGCFLHAEREGEEQVSDLKRELGSHHFAAQYMQEPVPREGGLLKGGWFTYVDALEKSYQQIVLSWDTAIKTGKNHDYTVCTAWGVHESGYDLLDVVKKKMEYPELKREFIKLAEYWAADAVLLEDKASGQSLLQDMRRETQLPVIGIKPSKDKVTRMAQVTALFEAGVVRFPKHALWLAELEKELLQFPNAKHDDQVDSVSQFLGWIREKSGKNPTIRKL